MGKRGKEKWGGINDGTQGVRDDEAWRDSVLECAEAAGIREPNYVSVRDGGPGTYTEERRARVRTERGSEAWNQAREEDSLGHVENLLSRITFCIGLTASPIVAGFRWSEAFSDEDRAGTDLEVTFSPEFSDFCGFPCVGVQVKSSETGVEAFASRGKTKFGSTGAEWIRQGRILLDGQWVDGSVVADFLIQLMNLMGIYQSDEEVADFVSCLDGESKSMYLRGKLQIEQYRVAMLEWIHSGPHKENGGKTTIY